MSKKNRAPIPVNVIAGTLGVGKTTTINHLLSLRPENEKWAILVNEYGLIGLDAALMETPGDAPNRSAVDIREVSGGCICCSAGFMFEVSLVMLLQRRPDRLLIEPTGLAALSGILDALDRPGIRESVDIRSILCLLDPKRFEMDMLRDEVKDQIEAADILLASRSDLATDVEMQSFSHWANGLFPPKRQISAIEYGRVSLDVLDLVSERDVAVSRAGHRHGTDHQYEHHDHAHHDHAHHDHAAHDHAHHDHADHDHAHHDHDHDHELDSVAEDSTEMTNPLTCDSTNPVIQRVHVSEIASTVGWVCWNQLVFDRDRVSRWMKDIARLPNASRTKAVLRTNDGWRGFNFFDGMYHDGPTGYRRDSRLEFIFDGPDIPDVESLKVALRECEVSNSI